MHRDANKLCQHVASSRRLRFPSRSLSYNPPLIFGFLMPTFSNNPPWLPSLPHSPALIRVLFLGESCCRHKDFAASAAAELQHPHDDSGNLATYEEAFMIN